MIIGERPEWQERAACRGRGTARWFPDTDSDNAAKAICATCPVAQDCLTYALTHHIADGTWGGLNERERRRLRRTRRRGTTDLTIATAAPVSA